MSSHAKRFYLREHLSPTYYNLSHYLQARGWNASSFLRGADFSEDNLDFNEETAQCLEYKHLLAALISQYCPQVMPKTYNINDINWPQVLNQLIADEQSLQNPIWILKPALLNNGQHIKHFRNLNKLKQHYSSTNRLGGEHVLQQYIANPHLLRDFRKYSIRQFIVLTNYAGAFLYRHGYFNVALHPYVAHDLADLKSHLTNEHLYGFEPNVIQIPTAQFELFANIYPQIKAILTDVISSLQQQYPESFKVGEQQRLALFGMDFMVDATGRVWLLEANHGPCFPVNADHPLQSCLYKDFWNALIDDFILPIANKSVGNVTESLIFDRVI